MKRFSAILLLAVMAMPSWSVALAMVSVATLTAGPVAAADAGDADHDHDSADHEGHDHEAGDHEAGGHGEDHAKTPILSFDFGSAFWNLAIFVAVLLILSIFVWPNVLGGLQSREDKIREDLESAEKANAEAQSLLAGYQSKLDEASTQVQTMLAEARKDAETNGAKIVETAKAEAAAQRDRALTEIETAKKVALADLAGQTSEMAMQVARGVVGRELSADDHADLIKQAMDRMPSQN